MAKKATLILMRHGQTDYNVQRRMSGRHDIPLNETGEAQAHEAGKLLRDIHIDRVYSSPLSRAFNTAAIALKEAGKDLPIETRPELLEGDAGRLTGRSIDTDPEAAAFTHDYATPFPEGESDKEIVARLQKVFDAEIRPALDRGETVLVSCHAGVMHLFNVVLGIVPVPADNQRLPIHPVPNATPMVCDYEDGRLVGHRFLENPVNENRTPSKESRPPRP